VQRFELRNWKDRLLSAPPVGEFGARYGYPLAMVHRAELHRVLLKAARGALVRFSSEVVGFDQGATVRATLRSGERLEADLLVGADGIRSSVRRMLLGDGEPRYSGATCWRGVTHFDTGVDTAINWWGRGGEFGVFPLSGTRVYWFAVQNRPPGEADSGRGRKADVIDAFGSWPSMVRSTVEATEEQAILRNDLHDRPAARCWTRGRVALVGDAAHPMLPNAAQGACQALLDAVTLASLLAKSPLPNALASYERRRMRVADGLVSQARQTARLVQSTNRVVSTLRDGVLGRVPRRLYFHQLDSVMDAGE
jgi:2-polyprenyl-6-methoxyphenol hydroxylase-like FAD-dependent oxidoreductase